MPSSGPTSVTAEPGPPPEKRFLTKRELARLSGLSEATIQRLKDAGRLPFFQPGGKRARVLYPRDAIEASRHPSDGADAPSVSLPTTPSCKPARPPKRLSGPVPRWQRTEEVP